MNELKSFEYYEGQGVTAEARGRVIPPFTRSVTLDDPAGYIAGKELRDAVNVALILAQPLLITGEPGTGKTQLASSMAYEFGFPNRENAGPLIFHTKTTSTAKDLFYRYDALQHFHDANIQSDRGAELAVESYITFEALGLAILLSCSPDDVDPYLPPEWRGKGPLRSVVLIDEIDKAPRDLPNDILNEVENLSFSVKETGKVFKANENFRPIVILTSNSEKNLPEAFLRRCVFYHIDFPTGDKLKEIITRRIKLSREFTPPMLDEAIKHFEMIRELPLKKKPATAELLAWLRVLDLKHLDLNNLKTGEAEALALTYAVLAKSREDRELIAESSVR